jgi:hypothetical protein
LGKVVGENFPPELLAVVQGGPEFSRSFASMPWDHLTYTGSTRVGRLIAEAAADLFQLRACRLETRPLIGNALIFKVPIPDSHLTFSPPPHSQDAPR